MNHRHAHDSSLASCTALWSTLPPSRPRFHPSLSLALSRVAALQGGRSGAADFKLQAGVLRLLEDVREYGLRVKTVVIITSDSDQSEAVRALLRAEPVINVVVVHNSRTFRELMTSRAKNLTTIRWDLLKNRRRGKGGEVTRTVTPARLRAASPAVRMGLADPPAETAAVMRPAAASAGSPSAAGAPAAAADAVSRRIAANMKASPAALAAVAGGDGAADDDARRAATIVPSSATMARGRTPRAAGADVEAMVEEVTTKFGLTRIASGGDEGDEPFMDASQPSAAAPDAAAADTAAGDTEGAARRARSAMRGANGAPRRARSTSVTFAASAKAGTPTA